VSLCCHPYACASVLVRITVDDAYLLCLWVTLQRWNVKQWSEKRDIGWHLYHLCIANAGGNNSSQEHLMEPEQLAEMGTHFLHILTTMKHNGAIDKTQAGFTALVQR